MTGSIHLADDDAALRWWYREMSHVIYAGAVAAARGFTAGREAVIADQAAHIRDLSTPIIPVHAGILVVPLVGALDARRAGLLLETLLVEITTVQAESVIIDITGVPVVDSEVANYLIQAAQAIRLLGAQVVLVGIKPAIAQTLVQLSVNLADLATRADLQAGVVYALGLQRLAVLPR